MIKLNRQKTTITLDPENVETAKKNCKKKQISLSRLIDNYLVFFNEPKLYCFNCGESFESGDADVCPQCSYVTCSHCDACGCDLSSETRQAIFYMRKVYEDLLSGRIK